MTALNRACKMAAAAGATHRLPDPDDHAFSPDGLWRWMEDAQKDGVIRMVRAALTSLKAECSGSCVEFSKMLDAILSENALEE